MTLIMVATSALNVKVMGTQARVNGESNHVSTSVDVAVWLESTMNRVSDGDRSTSLSFLSCGALQSGEIIGILKQLKAVQKEEEDRKANHAEIVAAKKEDIATVTATIETKLARQGDLAVEVESLKNDVADQELAAKLAESCSGQSSEREERQESRAGEGSVCESCTSRKTVTCHISLCLYVLTERDKYVWLVQSR